MKKRKLFSVILSLLILCSVFSACSGKTENVTEPANEETTAGEASGITVYVSIADNTPKLTWVGINVTDADSDGTFTICDALYCAHEQCFPEGTSGFAYEETEYGLSLTKLGGIGDGAAFSYYHNNASPMSLLDEVKDGDSVYAFVFTDSENYSDTYCYFSENRISTTEGEYALTLTSVGFDKNWAPVEGAEITVDGEKTGIFTDTDGIFTVTLTEGDHIISAVSDAMTMVPPVCTAKVTK